jgi:hypothetical protein
MAMAEEVKTKLIIWSKTGDSVAYALAEEPKLTFAETDLVITTESVEVSYPLDDIKRLTYEASDYSAIRDIETDKISFSVNGELLVFPSLKANSTVSLYLLNGTSLFRKTVQAAGEYSFQISNLNAGVYIVKVNGITYKFVKK